MGSWIRGKCIGKGAFGSVSIALRKFDGFLFAVKSVNLKTGLPGQLEALENEIRILQRMSSPHVVTFLGDDATCEHRNLHLEYLPGGTLADVDGDMDEILVRHYTWCLVSALQHVHSNSVVHRDVKGKNVLVGASGCKLADFGSAVEFSSDELPPVSPRGSPLWMAPEVIRGEYQGPESDVWSLGCTLIEMLTGKPAWQGNAVDALRRIGYSGELPAFPTRLSELGRDFLEKCLRREPRRRWSCDQLLQHPFLLPCSASEVVESSPRCVLDRVDSEFAEFEEEEETRTETENSARDRIGKLAMSVRANWETQGWMAVRAMAFAAESTVAVEGSEGVREGTYWENSTITRVEQEINKGANSEYSYSEKKRVNLETCNLVQWRDEGESEWNRKESVAGWSCSYGWENVDRNNGIMKLKWSIGIWDDELDEVVIFAGLNIMHT
ncbi:mitogen-activated protein kinase kinase kinase 18-like [Abrus precatorius]|uniref:Mitogen-activated protein kinase kinase kinase 18-like n=1 Tax=Abrus precatorius TaxID=3816 RepID=A0A8B8K189_ABRPR|nr:mitogen-activated protein kinase kinase kinase 18-like [Abrus precatorius]